MQVAAFISGPGDADGLLGVLCGILLRPEFPGEPGYRRGARLCEADHRKNPLFQSADPGDYGGVGKTGAPVCPGSIKTMLKK